MDSTPGDEGKWFAAAKEAGLYEQALQIAQRAACDPKTLTRACRDHLESPGVFALECGLLALKWLTLGAGYEITGADVWAAYSYSLKAAAALGCEGEARARIRSIVSSELPGGFVYQLLGREVSRP